MPNWCQNTVQLIHQDKEKLNIFNSNLKKGVFFDFLRPELDNNPDWYHWRLNKWGCKWEADVNHFSLDDDTLFVYFDTPWSPPIALYKYLVNLGWDVNATYSELGCEYCGQFVSGLDYCIDNIFDKFIAGELPDWALEEVGYEIFTNLDDDGYIDEEGNLLKENKKGEFIIDKKSGCWGHVHFLDKFI